MAKSTQSRRESPTTVQPRKTHPRTASKTSPAALAAKKEAPCPEEVVFQPRGKIEVIVGLLRRPKGAAIEDLMQATGWQAHSVRGAISAAVKKRLGLNVTSEKKGTVRLYRIADKTAG